MNEKLLQFIWQNGYFSPASLATTRGEPLQILNRGQHNTQEAGPDFLDARIRIGPALLAGSVELHIRSSDWDRHGHSTDPNYRNVILHVVYIDDQPDKRPGFPVLELQPRIPHLLLDRYGELLQQHRFIPCERTAANVSPLQWTAWKDRLLVERLQQQAARVDRFVSESRGNWEEAFWWLLARSFGIRVNADAFEEVARSLPLSLMMRYRTSIHKLEALLLGQANLLQGSFREAYPQMLQREYRYLAKLHALRPVHRAIQFLRMRPQGFPTIRLAQLAMLLHAQEQPFSRILDAGEPEEIRSLFDVTANDYWHDHFRFDETAPWQPKHLGTAMADTLLINAVVPLLFTVGRVQKRTELSERALRWLRLLPAEQNRVLEQFRKMGIDADGAGDAQALLFLHKEYCSPRRCLHCAIGNVLLKQVQ